jgi:hypothetical protein
MRIVANGTSLGLPGLVAPILLLVVGRGDGGAVRRRVGAHWSKCTPRGGALRHFFQAWEKDK